MRPASIVIAAALAAGGWACDSNPTPHPERDATNTAFYDSANPAGEGPDDDNDGVPDCVELNGTWDGSHCQTPPDGLDTTAGGTDGDAFEGDGDAGDGGDEVDAIDDDGDTASSPAD
ncbi:MAG: hypothetical protein U1F43_31585 [Myxococcota bacterium]